MNTPPRSLNMPPRIVIAPDKFKGTLTAAQVADALANGIRSRLPAADIVQLPLADGGDGSVEAALAAGGFEPRDVPVTGPLGVAHARSVEPAPPASASTCAPDVTTTLAVSDHGATSRGCAVVEVATTSGLLMVDEPGPESALGASSIGFGQALLAAAKQLAQSSQHSVASGVADDPPEPVLVLAIGGSACTDGGAGMLHALGVRFFRSAGVGQSKSGDSSSGREAFNPTGGTLCEIDRVDLPEGWRPRTDRRTTGVAAHTASPAPAALHGVRLVAASDVTNPLLGRHGTATVFAPQKGAGEREVGLLEDGLAHLVRMLDAAGLPASATAGLPGAGAAGGIGFACLLLGAEMRSGAEFFLDLLDFDETARGADLVITGEGRLDEQTAQGKLPAVLAARARAAGARRVIAVVGAMSDGADASGFDEVLTCEDATGRSTAGDADATRAALEEIGARLR